MCYNSRIFYTTMKRKGHKKEITFSGHFYIYVRIKVRKKNDNNNEALYEILKRKTKLIRLSSSTVIIQYHRNESVPTT